MHLVIPQIQLLVLEILGCTFEAHDALEDCTYLQKLVEHHSTDSCYLNFQCGLYDASCTPDGRL